jgi:probable F420-dependent oxidoreductase
MANFGVGVFQILSDLACGDPAVIAKRAEELGFDSYWTAEHPVMPAGSADEYPVKAPDEPAPEYLFKMPDPFVALARASATTTRIGLGTGICLIPERNPLLCAKEVASVDHYSGGRFLFGIGAGWNEAECTVMGGDFPHRWTQTREAIFAMKALWTGEEVEHHGKYYDFPPLVCRPRPARQPHPPVYLASIANPRVYRRVGQWGDGWLPATVDPAEIAEGKAEIAKYAAEFGRDPAAINISAFAPRGLSGGEAAEIRRAGADRLIVPLQSENQQALLAELEELAGALL